MRAVHVALAAVSKLSLVMAMGLLQAIELRGRGVEIMEMHQVRYFLAVCREQNFTRAAKRCGVSQPSLSNAIKRLEHELGGALFRRGQTETNLSELGCVVRPHFEFIERCVQETRRKAMLINRPSQNRRYRRNGRLRAYGPAAESMVEELTRPTG